MGLLDGWRYCPRCAGILTREEQGVRCESCGARYWGNSVPGVQALLERDGRVLLGRRALEPRRGHWDLPGGFLEDGEEPLDGLRRELHEETGLELGSARLLRIDVEPYEGRHVFSVTYVVQATGEPVPADDVEELRWFGPGELPEMAFPGQDLVLAAWRQQHA